MKHDSNDVKQLGAQVVSYVAHSVDRPLDVATISTFLPMLVTGTKEKNTVVKISSESALISLLRLRADKTTLQVCGAIVVISSGVLQSWENNVVMEKSWKMGKKLTDFLFVYTVQSNLVITRSSGGIFWDRGISEARYRFCRQVFSFSFFSPLLFEERNQSRCPKQVGFFAVGSQDEAKLFYNNLIIFPKPRYKKSIQEA